MDSSGPDSDTVRSSIAFIAERLGAERGFPLLALEPVPNDALVFWEDERADQHKRVVAVAVGNRLKLLRITVGRRNALEVICEAPIDDGAGSVRPQFITRDTLLMWAEPTARSGRGVGKTIVLRVGSQLKLVRVSGDEEAPSIEVLDTLDIGG